MIIERTHYFSKAGQHDATLAVRRDACNVRVAIGLPAGTIRVKADPSADGPDVAWECAFASRAAHAADLAARAASPAFEAVRARMRDTIERFERLFEERVAGAGGWAGDIDVAALSCVPEVHAFASGALKGSFSGIRSGCHCTAIANRFLSDTSMASISPSAEVAIGVRCLPSLSTPWWWLLLISPPFV